MEPVPDGGQLLGLFLRLGRPLVLPCTDTAQPSHPQVSLRCRLVAVMLHYCFLAAFCWMALEGVELYFLVVRVFQGQGLNTWCRCLIGYGVPLLIVAISAAVKREGYGHPT